MVLQGPSSSSWCGLSAMPVFRPRRSSGKAWRPSWTIWTAAASTAWSSIKLDRLTRSLSDWDGLIKRFFSEEAGRRLFSVGDSIDTRTAAGPDGLESADDRCPVGTGSHRRTDRATRCRGRSAAANGAAAFVSAIPWPADGKTLIPDPDQQEAIDFMRQWEAQSKTYRDMVAMLAEMGIETKEPGKVWRPGAIHQILKRPIA